MNCLCNRASSRAQKVKNLPAVQEIEGLITRVRKMSWRRNGHPLQYFKFEEFHGKGSLGKLQSMGVKSRTIEQLSRSLLHLYNNLCWSKLQRNIHYMSLQKNWKHWKSDISWFGHQQQTDHEKVSILWFGICKVRLLFTETCIFILLMVAYSGNCSLVREKRKFTNFSHPLIPIAYNLKFNLLPLSECVCSDNFWRPVKWTC